MDKQKRYASVATRQVMGISCLFMQISCSLLINLLSCPRCCFAQVSHLEQPTKFYSRVSLQNHYFATTFNIHNLVSRDKVFDSRIELHVAVEHG